MASELFKLMGTIAIDATGATQTIQAVITAGNDLKDALNGAEDAADDAGESFDEMGKDAEGTESKLSNAGAMAVWLGNQLTQLSNKLWNIGKEFLSTGFNFNLSMDTWTTAMQTLLGLDTAEAEAFIAKLHQFALDTPLSMSEVMNQATQLLATGTEQDDLIDTLSMLGDIAGGNSEKFSRIATAYWQVMTTGKLMAQDAHQLTQAGIPLWDMLVEYFNTSKKREGATVESLMNAAKDGDPISSDDFLAALQMATEEGGRFYNRMAAAMGTGEGQIEKVKDQYEIAAGALVDPFYEVMTSGVFDEVTNTLGKFVEWLEANPEALQAVADAIGDLSIDIFTGIQGFFDWMIENDVSVVDALKVITGAFSALFAASHPLLAVFGGISVGLLELIENKDKLDSWLSNTTLGGTIGVTQKEVEMREQTQDYLNMNAADYETDDDYQAARLAKLATIEDAYEALLMRVSGTEDKEELEKNLGMGVAEYLSAIRSDIDMLYKDGTTKDNLQLLNSLIPLWAGYNLTVMGKALTTFSTPTYYTDPNAGMYGNPATADEIEAYNAQKEAELVAMEEALQTSTHKFMSSEWFAAMLNNMWNDGTDGGGGRSFGQPYVDFDGAGGTTSPQGMLGLVQALVAEAKTAVAGIPAAVAEGVGQINITGTVTTGNVVLDSGAIVGELESEINMALGGSSAISYRWE